MFGNFHFKLQMSQVDPVDLETRKLKKKKAGFFSLNCKIIQAN